MPGILEKLSTRFAPLVLCLTLLTVQEAVAQAPYLVQDINTTVPDAIRSSNAAGFFSFNGNVLFTVLTGSEYELWISDLSEDGTRRLTSLRWDSMGVIADLGSVAIFIATDDDTGGELWRTDGTDTGTFLLRDINPGPEGSNAQRGAVLNGVLYLSAYDPAAGFELWRTDGSSVGTYRVQDIEPGSASSNPFSLVNFDGGIFFGARGGLWKTDGTESGTVEVRAGITSEPKAVLGTALFFVGGDLATGRELWATDGTTAGTRMVRDIIPGSASSLRPQKDGVVIGDSLMFFADDGFNGTEPWKTDGTEVGTVLVKDIRFGQISANPNWMVKVGEIVVFTADDGLSGRELWKTDGTSAGTVLLLDINPGSAAAVEYFLGPSLLGDMILFAANDGIHGSELWRSDGSSAGTSLVKDIYPGTVGALQYYPTVAAIGPRVIFTAHQPSVGYEPWISDGTSDGTSLLKNVATDAAGSSSPSQLAVVNDSLYFRANDGINGIGIWRSDGASTFRIPQRQSTTTAPRSLARCAKLLCFGFGSELWRTDGTVNGSVKVFGAFSEPLIDTEEVTFFVGGSGSEGLYRLYEEGAAQELASRPDFPLPANGSLFFVDYSHAARISDGTPAGTHTIRSFLGQRTTSIGEANGLFFFRVIGEDSKTELWRTAGTYESTVFLTRLDSGNFFSVGSDSTNVDGLFFFVIDFGTSAELWKSDGSSAGTSRVKAGLLGGSQNRPAELISLKGMLLFAANDGLTGGELWVSDGSEAGTRMVKDIFPGASGSNPGDFAVVGETGYFRANDGFTGSELWSTDGTPEGTQQVYDLSLGDSSSSPADITRVGNKLYFSATTPETGRELWALPLTDDVFVSASGQFVSENEGSGTFNVSLSRASTSTVTVRASFSDGTAQNGADFAGVDQIISFAPGELTRDVSFSIINDTLPEPDETIVFELSEASGAGIEQRQSLATIRDDDRAADLEIRAQGSGFVIFNHGPLVATSVSLEMNSSGTPEGTCALGCSLGDLAVGVARNFLVGPNSGTTTATVRSSLPDPTPLNNTASTTRSGILLTHCDHISTSGTRASLILSGPVFQDEVVTLTAIPSSAVSLPESIITRANVLEYDFVIEGLVEGPVEIRASRVRYPGFGSIATTVSSASCPTDAGPCEPASIANQPPPVVHVVSDRPFSMSVAAAGTSPFTYWWFRGNPEIGDTPLAIGYQPSLTTMVTSPGADFFARIVNPCGAVLTAPIRVNAFRRRPADFRGAGVSQSVIYRDGAWLNFSAPAGGVWTGQSSSNCIPAPGDYDGDGVTEMAMFCNGAWNFYRSDGSYLKGIWTGGAPGELPVPADYDGDGADDVVVYRNGAWRFYDYDTGNFIRGVWTGPGPNTIPVPGDYDGDGKAEFSVYAGGPWHFYNPDGTYLKGIWTGGDPRDIPVPGDYTVDGKDEVVIFRAGAWIFYDFITRAHVRGVWTGVAPFKGAPLQPAPLDVDGDGTVDFSINAGGPWHFYNDNGTYWRGVWTGGVAGDQAISRRQYTTP